MSTNQKSATVLHTSQVRVRFYDTDLSTTTFFTNHIKWFDSIAIIDFLRSRGVVWSELLENNVDVAVATVSFDYMTPIFLDDLLDVTVEGVKIGNKSIRFNGGIYKQDTGEPVGRGSVVYVFVDKNARSAVPVPDNVRQKLNITP